MASKKPRVMYMHTIENVPATFDPLFHIIHRVPTSIQRTKQGWVARLASSLDQVMDERRESRQNLRREKRPIPRYGYVRVELNR